MAKKKKTYDDDDGRSFADMSGVERRNPFAFTPIGHSDKKAKEDKQKNDPILSKEERRWYIFGALKSAILIWGAFVLGLGLFILILCLVW